MHLSYPAFSNPAFSNPALQLAQHEPADDVHAGIAVVETGNCGKFLAAIMLENLGILLRDLLQRFQAIGGKSGHDHCDASHAVLSELRHRRIGVWLQPLVIAEARLHRLERRVIDTVAAQQLAREVDDLRVRNLTVIETNKANG